MVHFDAAEAAAEAAAAAACAQPRFESRAGADLNKECRLQDLLPAGHSRAEGVPDMHLCPHCAQAGSPQCVPYTNAGKAHCLTPDLRLLVSRAVWESTAVGPVSTCHRTCPHPGHNRVHRPSKGGWPTEVASATAAAIFISDADLGARALACADSPSELIDQSVTHFQQFAGCAQGSAGMCLSITPSPWLFSTS